MTRAQTAVCTAVSSMSGSPTFDIDKKNRNGANLRLGHALRAGGVKNVEKFDSLMNIFNILKSSIQSIQNPSAFIF